MKILLEYNETTGYVIDATGFSTFFKLDATGVEPDVVEPTLETQFDQAPRDKSLPEILEMIRQGVCADDLIKLKNSGVI